MKKVFLLGMMLFGMFSIAVAQEPAMMKKGSNELHPVIFAPFDEWYPSHPEAKTCPTGTLFSTTETYTQYLWEASSPENLPEGGETNATITAVFEYDGYLKVTVTDENGNTGTDSIWFCVDDHADLFTNFIMEIDNELVPTMSGIITPEHYRFTIARAMNGTEFNFGHQNWYTEPGEWSFTDNTHYSVDSLWIYECRLLDTCWNLKYFFVPGMIVNTKNIDEDWYLDMKTLIQTEEIYQSYGFEYVYFVYTVDENGVRHHFVENDTPVILTTETAEWQIPGTHPDPYYQCGVAQVMDDGTYELLSLSNKVENPLPDLNEIEEVTEQISVYPNPAKGHFTVEGNGIMHISNILGQEIMTKEINGKETIELPKGLYFVRLNDTVRKIVVE